MFDFILIITAAAVVQCFCNRLQSFLRNWKGFGDILDVYRCDYYQTSNVLILNSGSVDFISTQEVKKKQKSIKFDFTKLEGICPIRVTAMLRYWQIDELLLGESQFCIFASFHDDNDVQLLQTPAAL